MTSQFLWVSSSNVASSVARCATSKHCSTIPALGLRRSRERGKVQNLMAAILWEYMIVCGIGKTYTCLSVCLYACIFMYLYVSVCICMYRICMYLNVCVCIWMYVYESACICVSVCMSVCQCMPLCMSVCMCMYMYVYAYVYVYVKYPQLFTTKYYWVLQIRPQKPRSKT